MPIVDRVILPISRISDYNAVANLFPYLLTQPITMLANHWDVIEACHESVRKPFQDAFYGEFDYQTATFPEYMLTGEFRQVWERLQSLVESLLAKFFSHEDLYPQFSAFLEMISNGTPASTIQNASLEPGTPEERNEIAKILMGHIEDAIKPSRGLSVVSMGPRLQGKVEAGKVCVQVAVRIVYHEPGRYAEIIPVDICSDKRMTAVEAESFLQNKGNQPVYGKIDNNDDDASTLCSSTETLEKEIDGVSTTAPELAGSYSSHELGGMETESEKSIPASSGSKRSRIWASTKAVTGALISCFPIGSLRASSCEGEVAMSGQSDALGSISRLP